MEVVTMIDVGCQHMFACDECTVIDNEFFATGCCECARDDESEEQSKSGARKTGRAYRRKMRRKTVKKYRDRHNRGYLGGPYFRGHWEDDVFVLGSHVKFPQNSTNKGFYKRVSNRKVRHNKEILPKGNGYRKLFDYWWTLY